MNQPFNGKGSKPRPTTVSMKEKDLRWKIAFGKSEEEKTKAKEELEKLLQEKE